MAVEREGGSHAGITFLPTNPPMVILPRVAVERGGGAQVGIAILPCADAGMC